MIQPSLRPVVGKRGFREEFARPLFELVPDLHGTVESWSATRDVAYIELRLEGTVGRRRFTMRTCDRIKLRDGKAVERLAYLDATPLVKAVLASPRSWPTFIRSQTPQLEEARMNDVKLPQGTIHYRESGEGPPVVFVHGLLVDGRLWRKVTPLLDDRFRCIVPDLPLGSHAAPMNPDADLSPPGLARMLAGFLEALESRGRHPGRQRHRAARSRRSRPRTTRSGSAGWCSPTATRSRTSCRRRSARCSGRRGCPATAHGGSCRACGSRRCGGCRSPTAG